MQKLSEKLSHAPSVSDMSRKLAVSKSVAMAGQASNGKFNKWDMLHMEGERKKKRGKRDRLEDEITYGKEPEEYTFQPSRQAALGSNQKWRERPQPTTAGESILANPFQISVTIGKEQKKIQASIDAAPAEIAERFITQHGIDPKLLEQLTEMIDDQLCKIKASAHEAEQLAASSWL